MRVFLLFLLLIFVSCSSETANKAETASRSDGKHCQVHGDSLIQGVVKADFLVGISSDSAYMAAGRRLFPNTRNILFPNGGEKGTVFLHCPTCDSIWKRYRPQ
jgi:hypothetical protein